MTDEHVSENMAKVGHIRLERRPAGRGSVSPVERLEQRVDSDSPTGRADQDRDDGPLLRTAECDGSTIDAHLHRTKDPVVHSRNVAPHSDVGVRLVHGRQHVACALRRTQGRNAASLRASISHRGAARQPS